MLNSKYILIFGIVGYNRYLFFDCFDFFAHNRINCFYMFFIIIPSFHNSFLSFLDR